MNNKPISQIWKNETLAWKGHLEVAYGLVVSLMLEEIAELRQAVVELGGNLPENGKDEAK